MIGWMKFTCATFLVLWAGSFLAAEPLATNQYREAIEMKAVIVDGKVFKPLAREGELSLGLFPEHINFDFGVNIISNQPPVRIRYKLEGFDDDWQRGRGTMNLTVRFYNESKDQIDQKIFNVWRESAGWNGSLNGSPLMHRSESVVVPPRASRLIVIISSAGPPETLGVYAVANLVVSKMSANLPPTVLLQPSFDRRSSDENTNQTPAGWTPDGNIPSMARIVSLGQESVTYALAIVDDSLSSHAEWHNALESAPKVMPGDRLLIEWNEMYSIGVGDTRTGEYKALPPGHYRFHVEGVNVMGIPTGIETSLAVRVPQPYWKTVWFWSIVFLVSAGMVMVAGRYIILRRVRLEILRMEKQQLLERERLRIAHDIHDDLGARVTQISLVSGMACVNPIDLERARMDFDQISEMSRDLVAALYETVWAVNPENDNLNELGNYLFQMVNKFCERTQCRCRFHVDFLPSEIVVSSQIRHNICLAVKEAVHNVIKHANASEVTVRITFKNDVLILLIQDNGSGFQIADKCTGSGLANLRRRLKDIGGICDIESQMGIGTTIQMRLEVRPPR